MHSLFFLYLDPGTGSLLLYAILGIFTTLLFLLKKLFYILKSLFLGTKYSSTIMSQYDIVIHSEGGRYFHNFQSIIDAFIFNKKKVTYVTPDPKDPAHDIKSDYFEIICLGNEYKTINFMNNLKANIVLSTTPHLDIYMWKKSKNVKKYVHIFHAPTSIDLYEKYALSFYDIIISAVEKTEQSQKYLDIKRNLPPKEYYLAGCPYYDNLIPSLTINPRYNTDKTILYAPTWGTRSSIYSIGIQIIEKLLKSDFTVLFRPHPQSFITDKDKINEIIANFSNNNNFVLDPNKIGLNSMINSAVLISDYSGIVFDYYYLIKRPIMLTNINLNINGYEVEDLPIEQQYDIPITTKVAYELSENEISNLDTLILNEINKKNKHNNNVVLKNFGNAGKEIFKILMKINKELQ